MSPIHTWAGASPNIVLVCQALDWKNHKILCEPFNDVSPRDSFRRALFFPAAEGKPRFVWVGVEKHLLGDYEVFDHSSYFGDSGKDISYSWRNEIQARDMNRDREETLNIYCMANNTEQAANQAIKNFTRAGACSTCFRGPYLVMRHAGKDPAPEYFRDMDMRDVRHAADYFSTFYRSYEKGLLDLRVCAVAILCSADRDRHDLPKYVEKVLNGADPVFGGSGSGIANLLGIPLLLSLVVTPDQKRAQEQGLESAHLRDKVVELLLRDVNSYTKGSQIPEVDRVASARLRQTLGLPPDADITRLPARRDGLQDGQDGFGSSPATWNGASGSLMLVRADGLPLLREQVETLCAYVEHVVEPRLSAAVAGLSTGQMVTEREQILQTITKEDFSDFFQRFKQSQGPRFAWTPSPYEMKGRLLDGLRTTIQETYREQERAGVEQASDGPRQQIPGVMLLE